MKLTHDELAIITFALFDRLCSPKSTNEHKDQIREIMRKLEAMK